MAITRRLQSMSSNKIDTNLTIKDNSKAFAKALDHSIEKAVAASALHMQSQIVIRTPVKTGRLRSSITSKAKLLNSSELDVPIEDREAVVGTNIEYAPYVEYGTKYQRAQPYIRSGAKASKSGIETIFKIIVGETKIEGENI